MKTAVSIPDKVFDAAERLAERLGLTRSEIYARAIEAYTRQQAKAPSQWEDLGDDEITRRIDAALAVSATGSTKLDAGWKAARNRALGKEDW